MNDIKLNYKEEGRGVPLVLIHGVSDDLRLWEPLIPKLIKQHRIIAIDCRGHGNSGKPDESYSIRQFSEDLFVLLKKIGIPKTHLLGLSMGAAIAQQFTLDYPKKVSSLILLSSFSYCDLNLRNILKKLHNHIITDCFPAFFDEIVKLGVTSEFLSTNFKLIAEMKKRSTQINSPAVIAKVIDACIDFNIKDKITQISCPTLIVSGSEDVLTPLHFAKQIHRSISGSKWKIMKNVGHNLLIPRKIEELTQIIIEFLGFQQPVNIEI